MFGYAGFAQSSFAALGSSNYALSVTEGLTSGDSIVGGFVLNITENIGVLDLPVGGRAYSAAIIEAFTAGDLKSVAALFASAVSEVILSDYDAEAVVATFVTFITENFGAADVKTVVSAFASTIAENVNLADAPQGNKTQYPSIIENITLGDAPLGFAWVKIDNTESTQWVLIDNRQ